MMLAEAVAAWFLATLVIVVVFTGVIYLWYRRSKRFAPMRGQASQPGSSTRAETGNRPEGRVAGTDVEADRVSADFSSVATAAAIEQCYKLAFSASRIDYQISGEHARVLEEVTLGVAGSIHQSDYFPRRPMLLPRLLQAINDTESTRQHLVDLILEDPAVAGAVLQRANSAFYRVSPVPVERLDRAVLMLGAAGLRGLMATAILQPVFRLPKGYFESFADVTWELARRSAQAAEVCARADRTTDPFVAQLLGLLGSLAAIVLFRLTMEKYREQPNLLPRAEVFIRALQQHRAELACLIARSWELSDMSITAAEQQLRQVPPREMSQLGRAMYYGELCGALAVLHAHGSYALEAAQRVLVEQGLDPDIAAAAWSAAIAEATT
jgi:HD-like signal output (HDOD) protein